MKKLIYILLFVCGTIQAQTTIYKRGPERQVYKTGSVNDTTEQKFSADSALWNTTKSRFKFNKSIFAPYVFQQGLAVATHEELSDSCSSIRGALADSCAEIRTAAVTGGSGLNSGFLQWQPTPLTFNPYPDYATAPKGGLFYDNGINVKDTSYSVVVRDIKTTINESGITSYVVSDSANNASFMSPYGYFGGVYSSGDDAYQNQFGPNLITFSGGSDFFWQIFDPENRVTNFSHYSNSVGTPSQQIAGRLSLSYTGFSFWRVGELGKPTYKYFEGDTTGKITVSGDFTHALRHVDGSQESVYTPAVTQNVYTKITPTFTSVEASFMTFAGDTVTAITPGHYFIIWDFTLTGGNGDDFTFQIRKNNVPVKQKRQSTAGAGNYASFSTSYYLGGLVAGDDISFYVTNTASSGDPTMSYQNFYIRKEHD